MTIALGKSRSWTWMDPGDPEDPTQPPEESLPPEQQTKFMLRTLSEQAHARMVDAIRTGGVGTQILIVIKDALVGTEEKFPLRSADGDVEFDRDPDGLASDAYIGRIPRLTRGRMFNEILENGRLTEAMVEKRAPSPTAT